MCLDEKTNTEGYGGNEFAREDTFDGYGMIPHIGMFVRLETLERYGFDESYRVAADYKLFLQLRFNPEIRFQYTDFPMAYFAMSGVSNTDYDGSETLQIWKALAPENAKKRYEAREKSLRKKLRNGIKAGCKRAGIFKPVLYLINHTVRGWRKHHCTNKYCRWCGRLVGIDTAPKMRDNS